ncbi:hypothetical protein FEE95_05370 [Maribacter algarum]|uniref:STAS/SEC14 domain-containing protein n=1 Tax=Maribacter algarum (ex Zhang et al. 2020) TaxID=2578118 RepID=A0A5S3PV69_9FLAO|nr:hypothetical protein [Maribacter algarum]TMM58863.1 hypothetical protein FEE95_05370 [Maribacter algarum]
MKSVKNIDFFKNIRQVREFEFGIFYFFDGLVISEMKDGVIFNWNMAQKVIQAAHEVLGKDAQIAYISNRINSYYVVPTDWIKFFKNRHQLNFYSVVGYTKGNVVSLYLERLFFRKSIRKFTDLEEAINWSVEKITAKKVFV